MKQKFIMRKLLCLIVLMAVTAIVSYAEDEVLMPDSSYYAGQPDKAPWGEVGWYFKMGPEARTVGKLGWIDCDNSHDGTITGDGFESDVLVSLWADATQELLARTTIPSGTSAEMVDYFRYAPIPGGALTLEADTGYVITFNSADILDHYLETPYGQTELNPYFVGPDAEPNDTVQLRYSGTIGVFCPWPGWPCDGWTYGSVNLMEGNPVVAFEPDPAHESENVGDVNMVSGKIDVTLEWKTGLDPGDFTQPNPNITKHYVYVAVNDVNLVPGDPGLTFEATVSAGGPPPDAEAEFIASGLDFNGLYYWRIDESISDSGPSAAETLTGNVWSFRTKGEEPVILNQPDNLLVEDGEASAVFTIGVSSVSPAHYQWYKSNDATVGNDTMIGTDVNTLTILNVGAINDRWYYVIVTNEGSSLSATSEVVHLWLERLIGQWKMNDNLDDSAGFKSYDGEWDGKITPVAGTFDADAIEGPNSVNLPGNVNTYITIPDTNDYFNHFVVGLTASTWVKSDSSNDWVAFMTKEDRGVADAEGRAWAGWILGREGTGLPYLSLRGAGTVYAQAGDEMDDGDWHLVTGVYEPNATGGGEFRVYLDGLLSGRGYFSDPPLMSTARVGIGCEDPNDGTGAFDGQIDDARIYTYPMTSEEVADLYLVHYPDTTFCLDNEYPENDLNEDCKVDFKDLATIVDGWLDCNLYPPSSCN